VAEKNMSDLNVDKWKQVGHLYLWRYKEGLRNYPGWNVTADSLGSDSLIDLLDRMIDAQFSSQQMVHLSKPTDAHLVIPNNGAASWKHASKLIISFPKERVSLDHWHLSIDGDKVILTLGLSNMREFRDAILDLKQGGGDYSIGTIAPEDQWLAIWWHPKKTAA
jgi:hypothetical protein